MAPESCTETYAALKLWVDNWRGPACPSTCATASAWPSAIRRSPFASSPAPMSPFRDTHVHRMRPNYLIIQIQPDEGMWSRFALQPGTTLEIDNIQMGLLRIPISSRCSRRRATRRCSTTA